MAVAICNSCQRTLNVRRSSGRRLALARCICGGDLDPAMPVFAHGRRHWVSQSRVARLRRVGPELSLAAVRLLAAAERVLACNATLPVEPRSFPATWEAAIAELRAARLAAEGLVPQDAARLAGQLAARSKGSQPPSLAEPTSGSRCPGGKQR